MAEMQPTSRTWHYRLLWLTAISSVVFNILLLGGLVTFRMSARQQVTEAITTLQGARLENFDMQVHIDEMLPVSMTVPFSDTFQVPISTTIPVSTSILFEDTVTVPINTTIPINRDIIVAVDIPVIGRVDLPIPIIANIPVNLSVDVEISREIPIQTDIPVDLMVDVPVQSEIPIDTEMPVVLDFPVTVPLDETGFQLLLTQLQEALAKLALSLGAAQSPLPD